MTRPTGAQPGVRSLPSNRWRDDHDTRAHGLKVLFPAVLLARPGPGRRIAGPAAHRRASRARHGRAPAINPDLLARRWDARWVVAPGHGSVRLRRLSLPQGRRPRRAPAALRRPRHRRQPLPALGERRARGVGAGARRPEPLAFRDDRPRAAPARRQERAGRGRVELRRAGAGGAGHLADGVPAAGRHEGRARGQHQRHVEGGTQPGLRADSLHLRPDCAATTSSARASGWTARSTCGGGRPPATTTRRGRRPFRRCRTDAPAARRGPHRTRRTGGCSCRGRSRSWKSAPSGWRPSGSRPA